jgi:hypothetical protein
LCKTGGDETGAIYIAELYSNQSLGGDSPVLMQWEELEYVKSDDPSSWLDPYNFRMVLGKKLRPTRGGGLKMQEVERAYLPHI